MEMQAYQKWLVEEQWQGYPLGRILRNVHDTHGALASLAIITTGLCGEAGEASEHFKKWIRDNVLDRKEAATELGDVLAYLTWQAKSLGYSLEDIAQLNYDKLIARGAVRK